MPSHSENIIKDFRIIYDAGLVKEFADIFKFIPFSTLSQTIGANNGDFKNKMATPETFTELQVTRMAEALSLKVEEMKGLISSRE